MDGSDHLHHQQQWAPSSPTLPAVLVHQWAVHTCFQPKVRDPRRAPVERIGRKRVNGKKQTAHGEVEEEADRAGSHPAARDAASAPDAAYESPLPTRARNQHKRQDSSKAARAVAAAIRQSTAARREETYQLMRLEYMNMQMCQELARRRDRTARRNADKLAKGLHNLGLMNILAASCAGRGLEEGLRAYQEAVRHGWLKDVDDSSSDE